VPATPTTVHGTPIEVHGTATPSVPFAINYLTHLIIRKCMIGNRRLMTREVKYLSADGLYKMRFSSVRQHISGCSL
jgi:hypothetical protein